MSAQSLHDSLIGRLFYHVETNPSHDAVVTEQYTLSYAQLARLVVAQVKVFKNSGISKQSIIGIKSDNDSQHLIMCLASAYLGCTSCTIPTHEQAITQKSIIKRCGATHVVDENNAINPTLQDSSIDLTPTDFALESAFLFSTSGTTGEAKLVIHHDNDIVAQAYRHINNKKERFICLASMEHNFSKRHRLYCVAEGATNVFIDTKQQQPLLTLCQTLQVNVMHVSAFQAQELLAAEGIEALSSVRLKLGGSHVPHLLRKQLQQKITRNFQAGYGTTETGAIAFTDPNDANAGESVGQALPGIEIQTVSPDGKVTGKGKHGEITIRCKGMFRGYLGKPELTKGQLKEGWFYTGDIGYLDELGRIHLCGRLDDMFVFNSMNIYPQDIESQICQHPDVSDAAVLPKASSVHGNIPVALIVVSNNVNSDISSVKKFVRERVGVRCPRQFTIVKEIPRNATGKIMRSAAIELSTENDDVRQSIIQALTDAGAIDKLKPALVSAFIEGDKDITLHKIGLDSLARMELLILLETEYNTIILPQQFSRLRTLNEIVSVVSSPALDAGENIVKPINMNNDVNKNNDIGSKPYVIRFFQRAFTYCHTVAQLNKVLFSFEHRLTPIEVDCLFNWNLNKQLIPIQSNDNFKIALSHWLQWMKQMMLGSGKSHAESFISNKVAPAVMHCVGPGSTKGKTLIICFSAKGTRHLLIPNAVFLQYSDSTQYDFLIIAEPLRASYRLGVPFLGNNESEVIGWLNKLDLIKDYKQIRTLGISAGGYPAVLAGYKLGAELAISIGGRFPTERHPIRILSMILTTWRAKLKKHSLRILLSYDIDKTRDRTYAKTIAWLCRANLMAVEFNDHKVGHRIFESLINRGELASYLSHTIFADIKDDVISSDQINMVINFPSGEIRRLNSANGRRREQS